MTALPDYRCTWPKCDCLSRGPTCKMADLAKDEDRQAERDAIEACADLDQRDT